MTIDNVNHGTDETPVKSPGFWKRNKRNILLVGISTAVAAAITYIVTEYATTPEAGVPDVSTSL